MVQAGDTSALLIPGADNHARTPARTLPEWANGLESADAPEGAESVEHNRGARRQEEMSWELRTDTVGPAREYEEPSLGELQASHARQLTHYKNLLIRAQSASSSSLHDALTRLHELEERYARLEAEYARCREADIAREKDSQLAGHLGRGSLVEAVKRLSKSERVRILGIMAEACDPSDIDAQIAALEKYKRTRFDILGRLGPKLAVIVMGNLLLDDILNLRLVSRRHLALSQENELWRHLCQQRNSASFRQAQLDMSSPLQEGHWESEYRRLVRRDRNWRLGLAQEVIVYPGHKDHVTALKLIGTNLISGSTDGTIRIWDVPLQPSSASLKPAAILFTGSVSCLDYLSSKTILAAGFSDVGRVQLWREVKGSWQSGLTLAGHSHGSRTLAMNDKYLVSAGVDKVLVIWDFETGEKIARFGQQPNISAGLHLVHDKLISITIDGVARAYDVGKGEMIRQFKISDLSKQVDSDTEERKAVQDIGAGSGGSGMVQWASGSGSTVTCATKTLMVTMRWEDISADDIPSAKPAPRKSLPSTLGTPRILRSATTPAPSPITPQRQRMLSMKASSITASPPTASPASVRSIRTRPIAVNSVHVKSTNTGSPSVSSRMTSSIGTTAATSEQSVKPVSAVPEKTGPITVPDLSRVPQIIEVRRTPEVERGVFDPTSGRLVTSTRFAARAGSEKKIYVSSRTTTNELGGDWAMGAAMQGLDTPVKRPTCLTMDGEKLLYGCSDGSIVAVCFA